MDRSEAIELFRAARVARLATVRPDDFPHIVPITFAIVDDLIVSAVDHKPKDSDDLQRLRNLENNHRASVLVDQYSEDWSELWWVRIDGTGLVHERASSRWLDALVSKYPAYRARPPEGRAWSVTIESIRGWKADENQSR